MRIEEKTRPGKPAMAQLRRVSKWRSLSRLGSIGMTVGVIGIMIGAGEKKVVVEEGAKVEKLSSEFKFTEGPASDAEGDVYFTDQPNDRIMVWREGKGIEEWMKPSGRANGLCFEKSGTMLACADEHFELWRVEMKGKGHEVVVKEYGGKPLNSCNDVWVRPDGGIYFSDPFYMRDYWPKGRKPEQDVQAVYYVMPGGHEAVRVIGDMKQPNGVIGTPDGKTLYVADIGRGETYSYSINEDGTLSGKKLFCKSGSDGMTIDDEGNVYLTGKRGVTVYNPAGEEIDLVKIDEPWTANVCFGGKDRRTLFITASKSAYAVKTRTHGVGSQ